MDQAVEEGQEVSASAAIPMQQDEEEEIQPQPQEGDDQPQEGEMQESEMSGASQPQESAVADDDAAMGHSEGAVGASASQQQQQRGIESSAARETQQAGAARSQQPQQEQDSPPLQQQYARSERAAQQRAERQAQLEQMQQRQREIEQEIAQHQRQLQELQQQAEAAGRPLKYLRNPRDRPIMKLSVSLIDTYKRINKVYYEERDARRRAKAAAQGKELDVSGTGVHNHGWDDENYDYILTSGELFNGRYYIKERIGKGSFGQVVRAVDKETNREVAIKIIKSKKPFLMQAKTEVELLVHLVKNDKRDENNIVRLMAHFVYRNHQCLVFEMLSLNLYELLKNTQFSGVSLNLIRKFAKQILKALAFLARPEVDIIHCDLKPENILLRHPKRSGIKIIDFGSSCKSDRRMYSYIQSRFYRSPEVMLGLPYTVAIDMWSLGCILVEMHTGEPLFSGSDQFDQMQKIVKILGMLPDNMLNEAGDQHRLQFFHQTENEEGEKEWKMKVSRTKISSSNTEGSKDRAPTPSTDPIASLSEVIGAETSKKKKHQPPSDAAQAASTYEAFVDLIYRMLAYDPKVRITPDQALQHPFIASGDSSSQKPASSKKSTSEGSASRPMDTA